MKDIKRFIGFDIGAESGRCVVGEVVEDKLILREVHRFPTPRVEYTAGIFWDVLLIYQEILTGLSLAGEKFGQHFSGISIDTWGVDYVLIDKDNRILGYPYHYRDRRNDRAMDESFKTVSQDELYSRTGIQFMPFNTVFQLFAEQKCSGNLLLNADKMLQMPDFLTYMLCGIKKNEFSIVSTSSLANPFKRDWDWELIDRYGFPRHIFSPVVEPGTVLGPLLPELALKTGLDRNVPVIAGAGHDTAAAIAAVPAAGNHWAYLSSGTWSLMGVELDHPLINEKALKYNFTNEAGVQKTVRFLKNILGLWPVQECRRCWAEMGRSFSYAELVRLAEKTGPAKAWINLDDWRFAKAGDMPALVEEFLQETGQNTTNEPGFIIRVILESLAFSYHEKILEIEELTGTEIKRLHAVGGGIQNELLTRFAADAINREVIAGPTEGTIAGNIGVQAIASGIVSDIDHWRRIIRASFDLKTYQPQNARYFIDNLENYLKIKRS